MLSLEFIRREPDRVRRAIREKGVPVDLDEILRLDAECRRVREQIGQARARRNRLAAAFRISADAAERAGHGRTAGELRAEIQSLEELARDAEERLSARLLWVPNIPWEGAPMGPDAAANRIVRQVGEPPRFDFEPRDHVELLARNGWAEQKRVAGVSGARTYALKGRLALLEQVLWLHAAQRLSAGGFSMLSVPALAHRPAFVATGHFPTGEDDIFHLPRDGLYLAGTAEVVLNSLHAGEILPGRDLPLLYAGFSPCFRREAGSAGRDVRGLLRVHQFFKVEQYVICRNDHDESSRWHARLLDNAETILADLELPYQVVECSTGDMGAGKVRMNDIECWVPSLSQYRETHSCSSLHDWQARRTNIRYRDAAGEIRFVHTLNNTAIATPRILVPLLETHQTKEGRVRLPRALRGYFGGDEFL